MKQLYILYIGIETGLDNQSKTLAGYLVRLLSIKHHVHLLGDLFNEHSHELRKSYDLILIQNTFCLDFYKKLLRQYIKSPVLFIAATQNVNSYVAPFNNLLSVLNMTGIPLSSLGIPDEMQVHLNCPVEKFANCYFYEQQPEVSSIVYCPTGNSIQENDLKLLKFLHQTNASLTIVSDDYQHLKNVLSPFAKISPKSSWFSAYKKAHLVVATGQDAVRAMALCKPCVVLGDYGLGGMVTPENYNHLQCIYFRGRKGGFFGEMVPLSLLESEIRKVFAFDQREDLLDIKKQVQADYSNTDFNKKFLQEIERIISISMFINNRKQRLLLKPCLSSLVTLERLEDKHYLMRGLNCFGEVDQEMINLLKQCDGTVSVHELAERNGYGREDLEILWSNLYELWKEKLILFAL